MSWLAVLSGATRLEAVTLPASPCTLGWTPSRDVSVIGYTLYFGITGSPVTNRQVLGMTNTITLFNLSAFSNYFFYVVAYNANGVESPPSNVLHYQPSAVSPLKLTSPSRGTMNLQLRAAPGTVCLIQYTPTLQPMQWQTLYSATADASGAIVVNDPTAAGAPSRYYRAVWYSNPQVLSAAKLTSPSRGTMNLQFHAPPGTVVQVQYTPTLYPMQWQALGSATADTNGNVTFTDRVKGNAPSRYYRAVIQ